LIQSAAIEIDKAERLTKASGNHFARKITARGAGNQGHIEFVDGKYEITAASGTLKSKAEADIADGMEHGKWAVVKHLNRFTPGYDVQVEWK